MSTVSDQLQIATSWLMSFFRRGWNFEDYPVVVREQADVPENSKWYARVLNWPGPAGLGSTENEARQDLLANLQRIADRRKAKGLPMPRPGTGLPIEFASTSRIGSDPDALGAFIEKILGFKPDDPVFISDESSLYDFGDDASVAQFRRNIREQFGVTLQDDNPFLIADILDRIRDRHEV